MSVDLLENCSECYQFTLSQFPEEIVIIGGLTPNTEYYFKVTDKFNNSFVTVPIETDGAGTAIIQVQTVGYSAISFYPDEPSEAWFNKDAGSFTIEASLTLQAWAPVNFTFDSVTYNCTVVNFANDDSGLNTIE